MKKRISPLFQQHVFDRAVENAAAWFRVAYELKWAADQLCWLDDEHKPIEDDKHPDRQSAIPVYRMLLGLSFENIIKGLLIAQGKTVVEKSKVKQSFAQHNIQYLLSQLDTTELELSKKERELLLELENYVVWQGRYPIPRDAKRYMISSHSTAEHRMEQELWQRMFEHLWNIGWKLTPDGRRVPLRE